MAPRRDIDPKTSSGPAARRPERDGAALTDSLPLLRQAALSPGTLTPREVMTLQRSAGNRAVSGMLAGAATLQRVRGAMEKMEAAFGQDFSEVRLNASSSEPEQVGARAVARGNEIHFAPGAYQPASESGQRVLGHELAHIAQQRAGQVRPTGMIGGQPVNDSPALEQQAEEAGARAARGEPVALAGEPGAAQAQPVRQYFFDLAWVLGAAAGLGLSAPVVLTLVTTFGVIAVGIALKSCLGRGAKNIDLVELKQEIAKTEESGLNSKVEEKQETAPDPEKQDTTPTVPVSDVKDITRETLKPEEEVKRKVPQDLPPQLDLSGAKPPEVKSQPEPQQVTGTPQVDEPKIETTVTSGDIVPVSEPTVSISPSNESVKKPSPQSKRHVPKKQTRSRNPRKKKGGYSSGEEEKSTAVSTEPSKPTLSRGVQNKLKRFGSDAISGEDVLYWQQKGNLPSEDVEKVLALDEAEVVQALRMDPTLFLGAATFKEGISELFQQAKVAATNQKKSEELKNAPKGPKKHPTVERLELIGVATEDAQKLLSREGAQVINLWLDQQGNDQYVRRVVDAVNKTLKSLADIDTLVTNLNPHGYAAEELVKMVMGHGYDAVAQALQDTAVENNLVYLSHWLGYGVTSASPAQLKKLVRFQARLKTAGAQLAVYQRDVEYVSSHNPPSRTGFLEYHFGGDRIEIHTHWNINEHVLVSMHVQDNAHNGLEMNQWKWFGDVATEVKNAHNRAGGNLAPTGGALSL